MLEVTIDSIRVSMMNYQHVVILKEKNSDRYLPIWIGPAEAEAISVKLQNLNVARPLTHDLLKNAIFAMETLIGTSISKVVVTDLKKDTFFAQIIFEFNDGPIPLTIKSASGNNSPQGYENDSWITMEWQDKEHKVKVTNSWVESSRKYMEAENSDGLLFELQYDIPNNRWLLTKIKLDARPSDAIALAVRITTPIFVEDSVLDNAGIILDNTGKPVTLAKTSNESSDKGKVDEQELKKLSAFYDFINTLDLDDLGKHKS